MWQVRALPVACLLFRFACFLWLLFIARRAFRPLDFDFRSWSVSPAFSDRRKNRQVDVLTLPDKCCQMRVCKVWEKPEAFSGKRCQMKFVSSRKSADCRIRRICDPEVSPEFRFVDQPELILVTRLSRIPNSKDVCALEEKKISRFRDLAFAFFTCNWWTNLMLLGSNSETIESH